MASIDLKICDKRVTTYYTKVRDIFLLLLSSPQEESNGFVKILNFRF